MRTATMPVHKIMIQHAIQAQISYVEAETKAEAIAKCEQKYPQAKSSYFAGPFENPGVYADF